MATSHFKTAYATANALPWLNPSRAAANTQTLLEAVRTLVNAYGAENGCDRENLDFFLGELTGLTGTIDTLEPPLRPLAALERKVVLLWTSLSTPQHDCALYVSNTHNPELCSIVNDILRRDEPGPALDAADVFVASLNMVGIQYSALELCPHA